MVLPSGVILMLKEPSGTLMGARGVPVAVLIGVTVPEPLFRT
jgi:hypothetical protein